VVVPVEVERDECLVERAQVVDAAQQELNVLAGRSVRSAMSVLTRPTGAAPIYIADAHGLGHGSRAGRALRQWARP